MKAIRINRGKVAATFSISELEKEGYRGGEPSRRLLSLLAERAFSEISEHPRRITMKAFISKSSLLLFAEESAKLPRIPS